MLVEQHTDRINRERTPGMKRLAMIGCGVLLALYLAAILIPFEPEERRPGTRLGGTLSSGTPTAWEGRKQIFVETSTWYLIPHSVTTTSWFRDGTVYVPCGSCATKRWPVNVASDPRVVLKIDGELFARTALLVGDETEQRRVFGLSTDEPLREGVALYRMEL